MIECRDMPVVCIVIIWSISSSQLSQVSVTVIHSIQYKTPWFLLDKMNTLDDS
jgi:hypothetical protein